jgi:DNA (cytosine-5)-methyltransferase 1
MHEASPFTYIDLFSGCGGLSLGLEAEGAHLVFAVEKSPMAAETFFSNLIKADNDDRAWDSHRASPLFSQAKAGLVVAELSDVLNSAESINLATTSAVDLVAGGPPCQGFSLAGRRNQEDIRNQLPWQFLDFVSRTNPKMVLIENVVGMRHKFNSDQGQSTFDELAVALSETGEGYLVQKVQANALHYGAPQHRPRLLLVGLRLDLAKQFGVSVTDSIWTSDFANNVKGNPPPLAPIPVTDSSAVPTVEDALSDLLGRGSSSYVESMKDSRWRFLRGMGHDGGLPNNNQRSHSDVTRAKFRILQFLDSIGKSDLLRTAPEDFVESKIAEIESLFSYPAKSPDGFVLALDRESLAAAVRVTLTRKHSQRVLTLNSPAKTIVTAPDDYVHPLEPRVFTVREMARFQGFPDTFKFFAKETTGGLKRRVEVPQYSQVGNAVSPFLGIAIAKMVKQVLSS